MTEQTEIIQYNPSGTCCQLMQVAVKRVRLLMQNSLEDVTEILKG